MKSFTIASLASVALAYQINQFDTQYFAQLEKMTGNNCLTAINRNKAPVVDFWNLVGKTTKWSDPEFTPDMSSYAWTDFGEKSTNNYLEGMTWKRAQDFGAGYTLWGDGATSDDAIQG